MTESDIVEWDERYEKGKEATLYYMKQEYTG